MSYVLKLYILSHGAFLRGEQGGGWGKVEFLLYREERLLNRWIFEDPIADVHLPVVSKKREVRVHSDVKDYRWSSILSDQ